MTVKGLLFVLSQCCICFAPAHQVLCSSLIFLLVSWKMGLGLTFWKCLAFLFWLVTDLWFGKAITVRGLSFQHCIVHFAKQLHLSVAWRAQPAFTSLSAASKAVKSPVSKGKIEKPHKCSDFCFDYHDFTLQGLKGNSSCASSNSWYLHVSLTYLGRKLAQSI